MKILIAIVSIFLSGCITVKAPQYNTGFEHLSSIRKMNLQKVSVQSNPQEDSEVDSIGVRAFRFQSPELTFDDYLKEAVTNELIDARRFDEKSTKQIRTTLLVNESSAPLLWHGKVKVEARFVVADGKKVLYDKVKHAEQNLEWYLNAANAAQAALIRIPIAYRKMLDTLYADPEFLNALKNGV